MTRWGRWSGWGARPILLCGAVHHVASLQTVWALTWQDTGLTELSTASYLAIVLCPGLKCASTMADMTQDISSKARLGVKVVLACPRARNIEPSEFILAWSNFVYSHLS